MEQEKIIQWNNTGRSLMDSGPWELNACLHFQSDMSYGYINGYRRAGRILYESLLKNHSTLDSLVYPILYLYRHHIEIQLKKILGLGLALMDSSEGVGDRHEIDILWDRVRAIIQRIYPNDRIDYINSIDRYIRELNALDPKGVEFRYHSKLDRTPSLVGLRNINLQNVVGILEELADCLDGIATDFDCQFEAPCEMERRT